MKLLVDACLSPATVARLAGVGHDVRWVGSWPADPGDLEVLAAAHADGRVLVTTDRGFGELAVRQRRPHAGIIVIRKADAVEHAAITIRVIELHADALAKGAVIITTGHKIRPRWPPHDA